MLSHYKDLLRQYWKTIILVALAAGVLSCAASIVLLRTMPQYKSSVTMNMEPSEEALRFNRAFLGVSQFNPATIITQTHIERLLSRRVAERALDILIADGNGVLDAEPPDAFDRVKLALWQNWARLNYGYFTPADEREQMVNDLMEAIDVKAVLGSYILQLEATYDDPDLSTRIANAFAQAYTEIASEDFGAEAARVDAALAALQAEKETELSGLMAQRRKLDRELGFESVEDGRAILLAERTQARQAVAAAESRLQALRQQLEGGSDAETESLRAGLDDAQTQVARRSEALDAVEAELQALDRTETRLTELDQKIGEAESDLAELQRQRITTELARKAQLNQVSVISAAVAPIYPVFPKVLVNTAVATILAALLAIAPVAVMDVLDDRVRTHEDLRQAVGGRALPSVSRRLVAQARRFGRRGRNPGTRLRQFAETMGRRFVTEGRQKWPETTIYVTAIGTPGDVTRLGAVIEAAVQVVTRNRRDSGERPKVVALPEMSQLSDLSSYRDGTLLIGVAAGHSDRAELARLGGGSSDADGAAPFLTVLM